MHRLKKIFRHGPLVMITAGLFFAGMAAMVKQVSQHIPLFQIVFFRAGVSAAMIGTAMTRYKIPLLGENQKLLLIRSFSGFVAMCLNFFAISKINLGDASLLNQCSPVFVMILSWIFLEEKFYRSLLFLTLLSFTGIIFILRPTGNVFNLGGGAGLMSAVFAAGAYVSIRRLHQTDSFWTMAFYFMATAAALSFIPMIFTWKNPNPREWLMLLGSGILGSVGQLLMTYAYKHEEASWVAPFSYAGVLFSFLLGVAFFGEIPDFFTLIGGALTVTAGIALLRLKKIIRIPLSTALPPVAEE